MTNLLRIEGDRVHRYVDGRRIESAELDAEGAASARELRQNLNHFLQHGLPEDVEPQPKEPGETAFERIAEQLENDPPRIDGEEQEVA